MKIWMILQITLTVISALFAASALLLATWFGIEWGLVAAGLSATSFIGVKFCKLHTTEPDEIQSTLQNEDERQDESND